MFSNKILSEESHPRQYILYTWVRNNKIWYWDTQIKVKNKVLLLVAIVICTSQYIEILRWEDENLIIS